MACTLATRFLPRLKFDTRVMSHVNTSLMSPEHTPICTDMLLQQGKLESLQTSNHSFRAKANAERDDWRKQVLTLTQVASQVGSVRDGGVPPETQP